MLRRAAAVAALLILVTAPACSRGGGADGADVPFVQVDPKSASPTDQAISAAQTKLRRSATDGTARLDLAQAFLQKARETADPSLYTKAGVLLDELSDASPDDPRVLITEGTLALAQHRFVDAEAIGRKALTLAPGNEAAYGVSVDANNELGHYDEALRLTQDMVDVRPNLSSLSRVSYARELRGDVDGAILAMSQAATASGVSAGENLAYVQTLLGNLLLLRHDLAGASRSYEDALASFAHFPAARAGQAKVLVAKGEYGAAADVLDDLVQVQPLAEYAIALGDARAAAGDASAAKDAYELVGAISDLYRANGVDVDLELALFEADHDPGKESVQRARTALRHRPSILGHDALAWNLMATGDERGAAKEIERALSTGSKDPLLRFHAAVIADANGDRAEARANLAIVLGSNPSFSAAHVDDVEALATHLGLEVRPEG